MPGHRPIGEGEAMSFNEAAGADPADAAQQTGVDIDVMTLQ